MWFHFSLPGHSGPPATIWSPPPANEAPNTPTAKQLQDQLGRTLTASIQPTTAAAYQHHWQAFLDFIWQHLKANPPFPAQLNHICLFLVHLSNSKISHSTIRTYLSAISFVHKLHNTTDPTAAFIISKTLQGIKNTTQPQTDQRLPITKDILDKLLHALPYATSTHSDHILWHAIFLLAYHACLRAGELTLSKNPANVISFSQVSTTTDTIQIQFLHYKHSRGHTPMLSVRAQPLISFCPVHALQQYLSIRGSQPGQLFVNPDKSPVTISQFSTILRSTAILSSIPPMRFTTHSFRIGKATQMAKDGHPDQLIRRAGRWKSSAYNHYLRPDNVTLPLWTPSASWTRCLPPVCTPLG